MTVLWPLTRTGAGETVVQAVGETMFAVGCMVNSVALIGQANVALNISTQGFAAPCVARLGMRYGLAGHRLCWRGAQDSERPRHSCSD